MNDKNTNILQQYDMTVNRTFKGRGTIICEADSGVYVLKAYKGSTEKLELLNQLQQNVCDVVNTDRLVRNKENELFVKDTDGTTYILKRQVDGRECNYKSEEDVTVAFGVMARLHKALVYKVSDTKKHDINIQAGDENIIDMENQAANTTQLCNTDDGNAKLAEFYALQMEKRTRECRHVKNYLRRLRVKNEFERALLREYDYFLDKAVIITNQAMSQSQETYEGFVKENGLYCHGDFQYHNILFAKDGAKSLAKIGVVNFEHFVQDSGVRDFYLLFRKILEKSEWNIELAERMLDSYQRVRRFSDLEWKALELMLTYPEKFWKIVNFYSNSRKSWIPERNMEKLENLVRLEKNKEKLVKSLFL